MVLPVPLAVEHEHASLAVHLSNLRPVTAGLPAVHGTVLGLNQDYGASDWPLLGALLEHHVCDNETDTRALSKEMNAE
jgi:hypothetical protein